MSLAVVSARGYSFLFLSSGSPFAQETDGRVQINLENLEKRPFIENSGKTWKTQIKKTEKSGTQGKLRELFCMIVKTFFWNFSTD